MWFSLARERDRTWAATYQHTDPRHPCYNGARAMLAPEPVIVECSGLGGGDLQLAQPWHVCFKTNKHNQRIYGPSMALVEESIRLSDKSMLHLTGLGLTKSLQEFLVLQYYATDSASSWYSLLKDWFPHVAWIPPGQLRHKVMCLYQSLDITPSHRRMPHPCWTGPVNLILSLLVGEGRRRIVFLLKPQALYIEPLPRLAGIYVRGFSAGSFVGLSLLHLLWQWNTVHAGGVLGAIACPSSLLDCIPVERMDNIVLLHYYSDRLCVWRPVDGHPLTRRTVYVEGDWRLVNHLGAQEHNYSHWLDNVPGAGQHQLWRLLLASPAMANPHKRDASALRLLSWLSFSLDKRTSALLAKLMKQLTITEVTNPAVVQIASESEIGATWTNLMQVRTGLIDQVSISNLSLPSEAVIELYRTFLARLSLPRLVHFLDLVLPQMHPHQQVKDRNDIRQLTSHYISLHGQDGSGCGPPVLMNFLFHSHAGLVHIMVEWFKHPFLVFSDYPKVVGVQLEALRSATTLEIYRQHVAFGIRAGQSTLFAFESQGTRYIMVGILIGSNVPPSGNQENRQWKHVAPHQTELAILPRAMAVTFCLNALTAHPNYLYVQDWHQLFSPTEGGRVQMTMHHIELLGETRSADDRGVFCTMPPERLTIGCGLYNHERPESSHPNQKGLLRNAAIRLLCTILAPGQSDQDNEELAQYKQVCKGIRQQNDGHFLSMVSSLVLAILTGRTDLCVSGVFGAGKTRAAAALIAGLMIVEPDLNLMVMTKENTAAKAFADHLLSLQLPDSVYARVGRIVGFMETKKGASHQTALDIAQAKRNEVLGEKKLLIGCGGGFQQESQQRYSPVKAWLATVHLALLDEAQQYGNIDELMTLARTAGNCLVLWCGDHRQTPGGLRNTTEAKMFRRKLLARPLGLRCDTEYVQPHLLGLVVAKFMNGAVGSTAEKWASYLRGTAAVESLGAEVSRYMEKVPEDQKAPYAAAHWQCTTLPGDKRSCLLRWLLR